MFDFFKKFTRLPKIGSIVVYCDSHGCQAINTIEWVGKVDRVEGDRVFVQVIKRNNSYTDSRDNDPQEIEELFVPKGSGDLQKVDGIWIMFK